MTEIHILVGGQRLSNVHDRDKCKGEFCTIHRNSPHHMIEWPQNWRDDTRIMERVCPHGIGHPDPDDPSPHRIHTCDGCCFPMEWSRKEKLQAFVKSLPEDDVIGSGHDDSVWESEQQGD